MGEVFRQYIFKYFSSPALLLSFWLSDDMNISFFVIVPQVPVAGFFFSPVYFLSCSDCVISIVLPSTSLIPSSVPSIPLLSQSIEFFILVIVCFITKISIWFFISPISLLIRPLFCAETFYVFICFKNMP